MALTPVGIDIVKSVFQVHHLDADTGQAVSKTIKRASFLQYFSNPVTLAMTSGAIGSVVTLTWISATGSVGAATLHWSSHCPWKTTLERAEQ
ncbi:hypothetical protein BN2476_1590010 [Paraburkholderia piptadeniae]|uniref:Uncharacterized protein n=1 Tax=Paraburkholderia piptadeniae TaxID=1701573 RepID=A0A1N7SWX2_9BURK|nr:hypothetical protein BN2476_1590010 [Paraburkholderia piptadeniae]